MNNDIHIIARAVIIVGDRILMCKHVRSEPHFYFLPGGHVEHWEDARTTLMRELKEESGLTVKVKRFLGCLEFRFQPTSGRPHCHTHEYNFIFEATCRTLKRSAQAIKSCEDDLEIMWVHLSDLNKIDLKPEALKTLLPKLHATDMNAAFESSSTLP